MFFYGNNFSCLFCCCNNKFFINRFDRMDIDYFRIDSVCCKLFSCCKRFAHFKSCCNDCYIFTFAKYDSFSDLELIIRIIIDYRHCKSSETHIYRSLMFICCKYSCSCFYIICRADHYHTWDCSHKSDIFVALMGSTIFTNGNTCMCSTDLNIVLRISDRVTNLFECTSCCEHCKCTCKRNFACCSDTSCNSDHVAFCDTTVDKSFRECFLKHSCLCSSGKVSIKYYYIIMQFSKFN